MSVAIENNVEMNLSQHLPTCEKIENFSIKSLMLKVSYWKAVSKQRKQLARLDERLLNDVGLTKEQVRLEVSKPFWK